MKKSEQYTIAMRAVIDDRTIVTADKIEILATLMTDKSLAEYAEEARENADLP